MSAWPRVTMNTALGRRLTTEQYEKLIAAACARRKEIIAAQDCQEWTTRRERYERIAAGDHWYRLSANGYAGAVPGGGGIPQIFDRINETLGIIQSVRRFLVARVCKDLFGSRPYFYVQPEGAVDQDLALKLQDHADWKLRLADYTTRMKEAVGIALDLGECPIKTTWEKETDVSERLATLLTHKGGQGDSRGPARRPWRNGDNVNGGQGDTGMAAAPGSLAGQPVLTADGDTIEDSDETTGGDQATDEQGNPVMGEDGQPVMNPISFVKAPEIQLDPAKHEWREHFVEEQTVLYQGLNISACYWRDVHWPINAPSLAKADFVSHTFDCRWSALRAKYAPSSYGAGQGDKVNGGQGESTGSQSTRSQGSGPLSDDAGTQGGETSPTHPFTDSPVPNAGSMAGDAEIMAILDSLKVSSRAPKSHESQPRPGEAEVLGGETEDPIIKVSEVSYDYDCFEDGIVRRLWLVLLPDCDQCLFADFRANISPRAAKPIHLVTVNQVKHRAYGKGLHETYEKMANVADGLLCAILYKNKINSDPTKIWNPDRTNEGAANPTLVIEPGRTYSIKGSQWGPKDILACVEIPDLDDRTWKLMELFMKLIQVDSGVTNANQGDMTDLPSNTTATGVNSMLESSSVLHQYVLEEIRDSLTPHLGYAIELIYKMQDRNETFDYLAQDLPGTGSVDANGAQGNAGGQGDKVNGGQGDSGTAATPAQRTIEAIMELADAKKLNGLAMKVEFLLTRAKRQEQREAAMAAIPIGVQYGSLPPKDQARMRDCFVQLFRALGFDEPEDFFPMPDLNTPPPSPPAPKAAEAIALKGADLTPSQKDALAQQFGLPAATPQETQGRQPAPADGPAAAPGPLPSNVIPDSGPAVGTANKHEWTRIRRGGGGSGAPDAAPIPSRQPFVDPSDTGANG